MKLILTTLLILAMLVPTAQAKTSVASTYGWPTVAGNGAYQALAFGGYGVINGKHMPYYLNPRISGVAHRSLPPGTKIWICFRERCTVSWVIDRGPYVWGRELDLTYALAKRLHIGYDVVRVRWGILKIGHY